MPIGISHPVNPLYNYSAPVTGFSLTVGNTDWHVVLNPAGTLAAGTIVMAATPFDGQLVHIRSSREITSLTISPNTGQSVVGAPSSMVAGGFVEAIYRASNLTWYFSKGADGVGAGVNSSRIKLEVDTTFYVSLSGNDATGTGAVGSPWRTPQHAYDTLADEYDFGGFDVAVQFANGDYRVVTGNGLLIDRPWLGGGDLSFLGNAADRTAVKIGTLQANSAFAVGIEDGVTLPAALTFADIQLIIPVTSLFATVSTSFIGQAAFIRCDVGGTTMYDTSNFTSGQNVEIYAPFTQLNNGGLLNCGGVGSFVRIFTFDGPIELGVGGIGVNGGGTWILVQGGGQVLFFGSNFLGTITGAPYHIINGGVLILASGEIFPSITPGVIEGGFVDYGFADWIISTNRLADGTVNYQVPTTGFSITIGDSDWHVVLVPAGTLATGTLTLPANPVDGQVIHVKTSQAITALTVSGGSGSPITNVVGAPTTLVAAGAFEATYRQSNDTWYCETDGGGGGGTDETITPKTANYTVVDPTDDGKQFTNTGAAGAVTFTLPPADPSLAYGFVVTAAQLVTIEADGDDAITVGLERLEGTLGLSGPEAFDADTVPGDSFECVACNADFTRIVACDGAGFAYMSSDSGATFSKVDVTEGDGYLACIAFCNQTTNLVTVENRYPDQGKVWRSTDFGATWTASAELTNAISPVWIAVADDGLKMAVCSSYTSSGGGVFTSTDGGATWTQRAGSPIGASQIAISADGTKLACVDGNSEVYISDDNGATWSQTPTQPAFASWLYPMACSADGQHLITGDEPGSIFTSDDRGVTWVERVYVDQWWLFGPRVLGTDGSTIAAAGYTTGGGNPGTVWTTQDFGHTWTQSTNYPTDFGGWHVCAVTDDGPDSPDLNIAAIDYFSGYTRLRIQLQQPPIPPVPAYLSSNDPDSYIKLKAVAVGEWAASSVTGSWSLGENPIGGIRRDTLANILASNPADYSGLQAYATDQAQMLISNGETWLLESSYYDDITIDLGPHQANRVGYGRDYITDKLIANSRLGSNATTLEGGLRLDGILAQVYLDGGWRTFATGVELRESNGIFQHRPGIYWISAYNGNSDDLGLNGKPIVQNYQVSLGPYPVEPVLDGGEF